MEQRKYLEIVAENGNSSAILKSSGGVSCKAKQAFTIQPPIPLPGIQPQIKTSTYKGSIQILQHLQ